MGKDDFHTAPGEALDITTEQVLAELDAFFDPGEQMHPGDVTVRMLMERYGVGESQALRKMKQIAAGGAFTMLKVRGPNGGMWVLRKVN